MHRRLPYVLASACFAAYATLSVSRHARLLTSGFDLGIFEQAVRGYAGFGPPIAELKGPGYHLLGDHFHPMLATLGPVYRVFPSPVTLLVAQALLLAVSVIPITRLAIERLGPATGLAVGVVYALSTGLQQTVVFDFHEICFAVPLLAFSLTALARSQWRSAALWALPLVLVKEDLPLTVAAIGGYLLLRRQWRWGVALVTTGIVAFVLIVGVVIPWYGTGYAYTSTMGGDPTLGWSTKAVTLVVLLAPTAFVALRSPLVLLALPTLAWRFTSSNPSYWGTSYHYGAVLVPILFVAFLDGLPRRWGKAAIALGLAVTLALVPFQPLHRLADPGYWRSGAVAARAIAVLDRIPDGASVAATNALAPQLTARCTVYLFPAIHNGAMRPDWVALLDHPDTTLFPLPVVTAGLDRLPSLGYHEVVRRDGIALWRRG